MSDIQFHHMIFFHSIKLFDKEDIKWFIKTSVIKRWGSFVYDNTHDNSNHVFSFFCLAIRLMAKDIRAPRYPRDHTLTAN